MNEDYSATMNVRNRTLIQDEWHNVWLLFVDKVSLLGAQLMCQIDHALWFAKENPNEWFGGINVIFTGNFYQYPPVALGVKGHIPSRYIVGSLWVLKQFAHHKPSG